MLILVRMLLTNANKLQSLPLAKAARWGSPTLRASGASPSDVISYHFYDVIRLLLCYYCYFTIIIILILISSISISVVIILMIRRRLVFCCLCRYDAFCGPGRDEELLLLLLVLLSISVIYYYYY